MLHIDLHIGDLALGAGGGLMDHHLCVGQGDTLTLSAGGQQECAHTGSHADADGRNIALDILHGVINSHAGRHGAAGAINVHLNVLVGVLRFQIEKLGNHQAGSCIVHLFAQEDDAVVEQTGKNIVRTLPPIGLFHNIRD